MQHKIQGFKIFQLETIEAITGTHFVLKEMDIPTNKDLLTNADAQRYIIEADLPRPYKYIALEVIEKL